MYPLHKLEICLQGNDEDSEDADKKAAKRYFSGDEDVGRQQEPHSGLEPGEPASEGVSSSTIVSGLLASRKQDHAVSAWIMRMLHCIFSFHHLRRCAEFAIYFWLV